MFYETSSNNHGLPHNPFKAIVSPRPIGWISSLDAEGRTNLAPYSFFNAVGDRPPIVMFSSSGYKDSAANVEATGEFVCNMASWDLKDEMNVSSAAVPSETSEFELSGLDMAASRLVRTPRVARAVTALECKHLQTIKLTDLEGAETDNWIVFGQVVGIHIDDSIIVNGKVDVTRYKPLSRLGYMEYAAITEVFEMSRPTI
ncbi:MAG: flavin reductase family protein [Roseibium album]|uniref:Flavin reductase like domain protein n=1 Tax=Roseibium album TaxID=311410 RepID=A0A0M6ZAA7_9HYPH|nr:flavin reductase family protein [Roseibium album]MBG6158188.1 flavin reductase (DIM6/NTAB) family NADH-FMN oxidoreductase RutF [Labrenzia sp. EL_162]MBG6196800.1 flavin reductase (DIM6/NTAB) family NADH-FMN oxidoreductase RutF [Labrenzia sp. EL_159]CTQ59032.1 Flavin reductase like domain protein [Roseibium album]CTQ63997.1 Flavin reductase like domain protein [Roseibium album]CTQ73685.1 Flavin reductase like domain protein [Roseibium album]